jgi:hypothetical protein
MKSTEPELADGHFAAEAETLNQADESVFSSEVPVPGAEADSNAAHGLSATFYHWVFSRL